MIATIAPLFIPYVGQAYGIATASAYFGQALAVFGKTVIDAIGDDTASKKPGLWQFLNKIDSSVRKFDSSVSDTGNQGMFNYEQFANLVTDVVGQLYQQEVSLRFRNGLAGMQEVQRTLRHLLRYTMLTI